MKKTVSILSEDTLTAKLLTQVLRAEGHATRHESHLRIHPQEIENACQGTGADIIIFDLPRAVNYAPLCRLFHEYINMEKIQKITLATSRRECQSCPYVEQLECRCFLKPFRIADIVSAINLKPAIRV